MRMVILFSILYSAFGWALEDTPFKAKQFDIPKREQAVIITKEGYYPQKLTVFEGEKIHFYVSTTMDEASCLLMPSHKLYISVQGGKMAEGDAYFANPGSYTFYCPAGKIKGEVTVLKRPQIDQNEAKREIASKRPHVWRPRED